MEGKVLYLITGASGGFGRAIAVTVAKSAAENPEGVQSCAMVLTGRNLQNLKKTEYLVKEQLATVAVEIILMDQSSQLSCETGMAQFATIAKQVSFDRAILFNNAGCLGDVSRKVEEILDWIDIQEHFTVNIVSHYYIASRFVAMIVERNVQGVLVNTSSLLAITPLPFTSLYCTGKAAADMLFSVMAQENKDLVKTLNYGPGPMATEMQVTLEKHSRCESIVKFQRSLREQGGLVQPMASAARLCRVLQKSTFESGSHVDFYDEE